MDLRDNFQSKCPVRYNSEGTHWYCKRQLSEKQEIENKTCNYSRCPSRELTYEEETERLLQIESKMRDTKKESKKDPLDNLMKKLKKEISLIDAEEKLKTEGDKAPAIVIEESKKEILLKKEDAKMKEEDTKMKEDPTQREKKLARKREMEKLRRERIREEKLKSQAPAPKEPEIALLPQPKVEVSNLDEIKKLEGEALELEEKAKAIRDKIASLRGDLNLIKCEWKSCNNMFKFDPVKKKKFCCDSCRMNHNSVIYRKKISLRKKELSAK
jgi:hypothetical protein